MSFILGFSIIMIILVVVTNAATVFLDKHQSRGKLMMTKEVTVKPEIAFG
ncbi:hypothetical protein ACPV5V_19315 [Vibrio campbellii]